MCACVCVHLVDNVFMSTNAALCFCESGEILCCCIMACCTEYINQAIDVFCAHL